jgi:hypothetical protein
MVNRKDVGDGAEAKVEGELEMAGFTVTNLNDLVGNCPFADLLARRSGTRVLVQVRGTTTLAGKFGAPSQGAHALDRFAAELDCCALYAFVHFVGEGPVIRFATAAEVATLAEKDEAAYVGRNRFHVNIGQFSIGIDRIGELLN